MTTFKGWTRCDWETWALPLYVTHLSYGRYKEHIVSVRFLCFGLFIEWSR